MAFDRPIEADKVDDINLFSVFVRAPVLGSLVWLLGGGGDIPKKEEKEQIMDGVKERSAGSSSNNSSINNKPSGNSTMMKRSYPKSALKKPSIPSLSGTECSDSFDCDTGECSRALADDTRQPSAQSLSQSSSDNHQKLKKRLSWSDESGQSLVEYYYESNDGSSRTVEATRTGSNLSRSRSIQAHANHMVRVQDDVKRLQSGETRYLPRGLDKAHNGIIMPKRPYGAEPNNYYAPSMEYSDMDSPSPQWGWFLRTTPPTPPMFGSRPPTSDTSLTSNSSDGRSFPPHLHQQHYQPNPVFQAMQDKNKASPAMGWSSVPL